jgi:hypothetical protein
MAAVAGIAGLLAFGALWVLAEPSSSVLAVPWALPALFAVLGAAVLLAAWPVRQYLRGRRPAVDALRAARVLALAKACALVGAGLTGGYLAAAADLLLAPSSPLVRARALSAGAAALAALVLAVAGAVAERYCRLPPEGDAEDGTQ